MIKALTVGELKKALKNVPNELEVRLSSDTGVDQGEGKIIVETARRFNYTTKYATVDYFEIYANDYDTDEEELDE